MSNKDWVGHRWELHRLKWLQSRFSLTGKKACLFNGMMPRTALFSFIAFLNFSRSFSFVVDTKKYKTFWIKAKVKSRQTQITRIKWTMIINLLLQFYRPFAFVPWQRHQSSNFILFIMAVYVGWEVLSVCFSLWFMQDLLCCTVCLTCSNPRLNLTLLTYAYRIKVKEHNL